MKIKHSVLTGILQKLADVYPFMLEREGYSQLLTEIEEQILDGHLLYLHEKGLIDTVMKYNPHMTSWEINPNVTRITAHGLDYLEAQTPQ